jgi:hypothetical protein
MQGVGDLLHAIMLAIFTVATFDNHNKAHS